MDPLLFECEIIYPKCVCVWFVKGDSETVESELISCFVYDKLLTSNNHKYYVCRIFVNIQ